MEAFIVAVVLIAALVFGAPHQLANTVKKQAGDSSVSEDQENDGVRSLPACDPNHQRVIQRDLTVPLEKQNNDNAYW